MGLWAAGPLGRWAAGLFLAKPTWTDQCMVSLYNLSDLNPGLKVDLVQKQFTKLIYIICSSAVGIKIHYNKHLRKVCTCKFVFNIIFSLITGFY